MFWRRKKAADPLDDPRFAPAGSAPAGPAAGGEYPAAAPGTDPAPSGGRPTLTVEDTFTITGRGIVATGAVENGTLQVGQQVAVQRAGQVVAVSEIAAIESEKKTVDSAPAGESIGLLLRGLTSDLVQKGDQIVASG